MIRRLLLGMTVLLFCVIWVLAITWRMRAMTPAEVQTVAGIVNLAAESFTPTSAATLTSPATVMPTMTPTRAATPTATLTPSVTSVPATTPSSNPVSRSLPGLYVDNAYIKRYDTRAPVSLKGLAIEEFRQSTHNTLADLYSKQGLEKVVAEKWGINLLRVSIDPESVESYAQEIDKLVNFAQDNGMYVILVPGASALNPSRSELIMAVPDDLVASAMEFLAIRYKDRTNVLYGLWNEPHPETIPSLSDDQAWGVWMQAGKKIAQAIRDQNPRAILVVPGGLKWARDLTYYKGHPFPFDNIIFDIHDYAAKPDYRYSRDWWTWVIGKYPLYIGEFGGSPIDPFYPSYTSYMRETLQIVNQYPFLVHYTFYVLSNDGAWGIFTRNLLRTPAADLLLDDLIRHAPSKFP